MSGERQLEHVRDVPARPVHRGDIRIPLIEMPRRDPTRRCHERQDLHPLFAVDPVSRAVAQCFTIDSIRIRLSSADHAS
jgi:hypothetical protein